MMQDPVMVENIWREEDKKDKNLYYVLKGEL